MDDKLYIPMGESPPNRLKTAKKQNIMPSIANQDFKIYGKLSETVGVPGKYCGELLAAYLRGQSTVTEQASFIDGFVFSSSRDNLCRLLNLYLYIDTDTEEIEEIYTSHINAAYYDALWAIQQAVYAQSGNILAGDTKFGFNPEGELAEMAYGATFVNEDGYIIKGTAAEGKLASLYLGEKAEYPEERTVVRLETLLPLVGELPLYTIEIW